MKGHPKFLDPNLAAIPTLGRNVKLSGDQKGRGFFAPPKPWRFWASAEAHCVCLPWAWSYEA